MEQKRLPRNKELNKLSKNLRNNATPEENKLWYEFLRTYPVRFNRQRIIENYIADFYCRKAMLVVELDGSQHYEKTGIVSDKIRTWVFNDLGITVLRFSNLEVNKSFYEVCSVIDEAVKAKMNE